MVDALIRPHVDPVIQSEIQYRLCHKFTQLFGDNFDDNIFIAFDYTNGVQIEISTNQPVQISAKIQN